MVRGSPVTREMAEAESGLQAAEPGAESLA
jgi:hypothetical protein